MFKISNNNIITMNRGDTISFDVEVNQGTSFNPINYTLREGDKLYFGLMEPNYSFEHAILKKVFTKDNLTKEGKIEIKIESDETVNLLPGNYYYEIKLEKVIKFGILENETEVSTILPKTKFIIL